MSSGTPAERRLEAVDGLAEVGERAEDVVVLAVGPVQVARSAAAARRASARGAAPRLRLPRRRGEAVVRQHPLPGLDRPVGAVGCLAAGDEPLQRRAVVRRAGVLEASSRRRACTCPSRPSSRAGTRPAAARGRRDRVDRAPGEHVPALAARVVAEQRLSVARDLERDVARVAVDQLGGRGGARDATTATSTAQDEDDTKAAWGSGRQAARQATATRWVICSG